MRALVIAIALLGCGAAHAQFNFPTAPTGGAQVGVANNWTAVQTFSAAPVFSTVNLLANAVFTGASSATNTVGILFSPNVADGASSVALRINNTTTLANAAAALLDIQNNGVSKFTVKEDGTISTTLPNITSLNFNGGNFVGGGLSLAGVASKYNNQNTAGLGIPFTLANAMDVASTGASTTLVTLSTPVTGLYRVNIVVSAHTNNDTVSATITYTDAVEAFATTLTPISSVLLTHDSNTGTASSVSYIRASAATNIVCTLSVTTQTTTKGSCSIERLN